MFKVHVPRYICILGNRRVAVDYGDSDTIPTLDTPDGMTIDTEDKIWVACASYEFGKVIRFDPLTGMIMPDDSILR